jgi:hypothetical protein
MTALQLLLAMLTLPLIQVICSLDFSISIFLSYFISFFGEPSVFVDLSSNIFYYFIKLLSLFFVFMLSGGVEAKDEGK